MDKVRFTVLSLILLGLCQVAFAGYLDKDGRTGCFCSSPLPWPKLRELSLDRAKEVLGSGSYVEKDTLNAVHTLLLSKEPETTKIQILLAFYQRRKVIRTFQEKSYTGLGRSLGLCAQQLQNPNDFFLNLSKDPFYSFKKPRKEDGAVLAGFIKGLQKLPKPSKEIFKMAEDAVKSNPQSFLAPALPLFVKKAPDERLKAILEHVKKLKPERQTDSVAPILCKHRLRPLCLGALIDVWIANDYSWEVMCMFSELTHRDSGWGQTAVPNYDGVTAADAKRVLGQIDRAITHRRRLLKHKSWNSYKRQFEKLDKIRQIMTQKIESKRQYRGVPTKPDL